MSGPFDEDDATEMTDSDRSDVDRAWHDARDDAQSDPRSSDPDDVSYTGDWSRDRD